MDELQNVATIVGIVWGLVGIGGTLFGLYQWRENKKEKRPRLVLDLTLTRHHTGEAATIGWFIANDYWDKPITIDQVGITNARGRFIPIGVGPNVPREDALNRTFTLEPGKNKTFSIYSDVLHIVLVQQEKAKGRLKIRAAVRDSTRRVHVGRNEIGLEILKDNSIRYE